MSEFTMDWPAVTAPRINSAVATAMLKERRNGVNFLESVLYVGVEDVEEISAYFRDNKVMCSVVSPKSTAESPMPSGMPPSFARNSTAHPRSHRKFQSASRPRSANTCCVQHRAKPPWICCAGNPKMHKGPFGTSFCVKSFSR